MTYQYGLDLTPALTSSDCICGKHGNNTGDSYLLLALAVWYSSAERILLLGGSQAVRQACKQVPRVRIDVVLGRPTRAQPNLSAQLAATDLVLLARGEVSHAATAPYLDAIQALTDDCRPDVRYPATSNLTSIAEEILWWAQEAS